VRDISQHIVDIGKAALTGETGNLVFAARQALTAVAREAFEDGQRAAGQDEWAEQYIDGLKTKQEEQEASG
jgi:hypothetical protein